MNTIQYDTIQDARHLQSMIHVNSHIQQKYIVTSDIFSSFYEYAAFIRRGVMKFYCLKITCSFLRLICFIIIFFFPPLSYIIILHFYHYVFSFVTANYPLYVFWHPQTIIILKR